MYLSSTQKNTGGSTNIQILHSFNLPYKIIQ